MGAAFSSRLGLLVWSRVSPGSWMLLAVYWMLPAVLSPTLSLVLRFTGLVEM